MRKLIIVFILLFLVCILTYAQQNNPPIPQNFRHELSGNNVTLRWNSAGSGIRYNVYHNMRNDRASADIIDTIDGVSHTMRGLPNGTHHFWVRSIRGAQLSDWSAVVIVRIPAQAPPPTPTTTRNPPTQQNHTISSGNGHTVAIRRDGTLWAWGNNEHGQLGDGTRINRNAPVQIGRETNWVHVSAGSKHTVAVRRDGTLWTWGNNEHGQLGNGTTISSSNPIRIGTTWASASAGENHTVGISADGTLWAWGLNTHGQLGNGTWNNQRIPVRIGNERNWVIISAGWLHTVGVRSDGTLWTWGNNGNGQLGNGTTIGSSIPIRIGTTWLSASAGQAHTVGVSSDGTLWTWGWNSNGQLGDGTTIQRTRPVQIGTATNWTSVSAGWWHTAGVRRDGTLWAWGNNNQGQLGDGTTTQRTVPIRIGSATNWMHVSVERHNTSAVRTDNTYWTWGANTSGQIGDRTNIQRNTPVQIILAPQQVPPSTPTPQPTSTNFRPLLWNYPIRNDWDFSLLAGISNNNEAILAGSIGINTTLIDYTFVGLELKLGQSIDKSGNENIYFSVSPIFGLVFPIGYRSRILTEFVFDIGTLGVAPGFGFGLIFDDLWTIKYRGLWYENSFFNLFFAGVSILW